MLDDPVLVDDWHPVARARDVYREPAAAHRCTPPRRDVVLWQVDDRVLAWQDLGVHGGTRLSLGRIDGGTLERPYHGCTYGADGRCVHIPSAS